MNAASGSDIQQATSQKKIEMPKILVELADSTAKTIDVKDAKKFGTNPTVTDIKVIGIYGNGANSGKITVGSDDASFNPETGKGTAQLTEGQDTMTLTIPAAGDGCPVKYFIMYTREVEKGIKLTNSADKFPSAVTLTCQASYVDPCEEDLKPLYLEIPSFMADPAMTLNLSSENQEVDFNGSIQVDYCKGEKVLYYIYYPEEDYVETGVVDGDEGN